MRNNPMPLRHPWLAAILHRWPTWLAIVMAAVLAPGTTVAELSNALPLLALGYLAAAALQRRKSTWLLAVGIVLAFAALRLQPWVDPTLVLMAVALVLVVWGFLGRPLKRKTIVLEASGMVGFTAIALAAVTVDPAWGRYLIAAGWLGHALWDFAHFRADRVVSRSFAEWCAVFDLLRALGILILPLP